MPFVSEAQRRLLWAKNPEVAQKWANKYGTPKNLPYHKAQTPKYKGASKYKR